MSTNQLHRAIWLVDLLRRYGRLTRSEINEHWRRCPFSNGRDLPRRSFFNYRDEIESLFNIQVLADPETYEYYLAENEHQRNMTSWLLHASALNEAITNSRDVAEHIFMEDVPSARSHLNLMINSLREKRVVRFDYAPYTRSTPSRGVEVEPYFLKLFKQRWYVTGRAVSEGLIKTYALDRIVKAALKTTTYEIPADFDAETYFRDSFGIVFTQGEVKNIMIKVDSRQAKYFRALPLHHSQHEMIHDTYSIFTYRMKISPDFIQELLSYGPKVTVLQPPELRAMIVSELRATLANYPDPEAEKGTGRR